jgi:hypothetical protein
MLLCLHLQSLKGGFQLLIHGELHGSMRGEQECRSESAVKPHKSLLAQDHSHGICAAVAIAVAVAVAVAVQPHIHTYKH